MVWLFRVLTCDLVDTSSESMYYAIPSRGERGEIIRRSNRASLELLHKLRDVSRHSYECTRSTDTTDSLH
jgi:hypothetical protein